MNSIDFGMALDWELDKDFIHRISRECQRRGLSSFIVDPNNLEQVWEDEDIHFLAFLDRASDVNEEFEYLIDWLQEDESYVFNDPTKLDRAIDKATMHLEFLSAGLEVPHTIILSPYCEDPQLATWRLEPLGRTFVVKPARGGGGDGVLTNAQSLADITKARLEDPEDKYLLQEKIVPKYLNGKRAWFRVFYVCGSVIPCWWNDLTHIFEPVTDFQFHAHSLFELERVTEKIADICELDFFSSEIAISESNRFVVVDYVNDQCDMRPRSSHYDGVPDQVIDSIVAELVEFVVELKAESDSLEPDLLETA